MSKGKTISEWYPTEATILKRVIKLKGGKLHESDFARIFNELKRIKLPAGSKHTFQDSFRKVRMYFRLTKRHSPIMGIFGGLQQQFLYLAQAMKKEGKINITHTTRGVFYSIPTGQ